MKIIFNPLFDSGYYIDLSKDNNNMLGTKITGTNSLLEHLCLHNGLSGLFASDGERASAYMSHVGRNAQGSMVETSFRNDALGVSRCLLNWRDKLIMAGWRPNQSSDASTPKLKLLSNIEKSWAAQMKGAADRWLELATLAKKQMIIADNDVIECHCAKEQLPRIVQDVLVACNATFEDYTDEIQMPDTANIRILHYSDLNDAYSQIAANADNYKDTVIINRDNVSLNHRLLSWGRPLVGATIQESNPLTLQLFKLALSVFSRPLNIQNLISYLQLPVGPVPGKLRYALANILTTEGGFGKVDWDNLDKDKELAFKKAGIVTKWQHAIYDYINEDDETLAEGQSLTKVQRESKTTLLKYITDTSLSKGKNIHVGMVKEYISAFNRWATGVSVNENSNEMLNTQLSTMVSYFRQLSDALNSVTEISYQDLEKHVRTIYQPTSIVQARAQVGALNVVGTWSQLLDTPEHLLWLDCCGADELSDQYDFLSISERSWLNNEDNITIPSFEGQLDLNRREMISKLSMITGSITLVTSDYHHNQKMAVHPLIAELKMQRGSLLTVEDGEVVFPLSDSKNIVNIEPKLQYNIDNITYSERSESNTSIDTLIKYPFDYTIRYIAKLTEPSNHELGTAKKAVGLVAHSFIEDIMASVKEIPEQDRITAMEHLLDKEYDVRLTDAVYSTGLTLMLRENEMDYNNLHYQLRRSVEKLIAIMKMKELTPVGCEMRYDKSIGNVISDFNARIDMELKDKQGNAVIFDFKWSYSKYYGDKIKEGTAIQLELYRRELLAQGKQVSAVGYYLFPKCVLETPDFDTLKDTDGMVIINHIEPPHNADMFIQIQKSVMQRRNELKNGIIEEGEGMDIMPLPYAQRLMKGDNLLMTGKAKKPRTTKANPNPQIESIIKESNKVFTNKPESRFSRTFLEFSNDSTPLEETPTTYPLMKGRLK